MKQKLLYDYFYYKAFQKKAPVSVVIELLTQCNLKCEHCYLPAHTDSGLSFETVKKLLYSLRDLGIASVSITGGEVFLREDIFDIIELARSLHMRVFILSNATLLDKHKIERLSKLYISAFSTTIFSMDSKIHDAITGCSGSLATVLANLEMLREAKIPVHVKTPIMKKNVYDFREIQKYCQENGFEYFVSPQIFPKLDGDTSPKNLRISNQELATIFDEVDAVSRTDYLHVNDVPCNALCYSFAIDCRGDVYPCNAFSFKVGNIYQNTLEYIWYESDRMKFIQSIRNKDLKLCVACKYKEFCTRCPGMAFMETNDVYACDEFARCMAELRMSKCNS